VITGVTALCFVSIVGYIRLDVPEKILFGDLSRQLRKVLDWRSLSVFSVAVPVGGILINLTIGMRLIDARLSPDLYVSIINILHWIPPLVAIQITYLIRRYLVRRNEGRILGEISRRNVIGFFNAPIVVVLLGLVVTGSMEVYLFWWLGRGFQFTNVYEFWAWSEITWAKGTPFLLTIAGTFWLLRESEKDRAEYMGLEFTKYPALRRYRQRIEFALEAVARTLSSLWALITSLKKDGSQSTSKVSESQVAPDREVTDFETSTTGNEITVHCNASHDGDSVDCQITFSFSSDKDRPSHLFYKGNVTTVLSSGLGEAEEEFWNGIANGDDPEIWTSVSAKGKPTHVSVSGNISIYDLSEDGLVEDVIAKDSRSSEVDLNGNLVFIQCIGFDEDGDFILRVDLSDLEGSVIGIRAGFEDGIDEADWDIDIVDLDREDSCIRQLVVYDIEDGYLVSLEIRVGSIAFDNYPFRSSASINA